MENIYQVANGVVKFDKDIDPNLYKKNLPAGFYTTASSRECILEANRTFDNSI